MARLLRPLLAVGAKVDRLNVTVLKFALIFSVACVGLTAGWGAGLNDVKAFSAKRLTSKRC